MDNNKKKLVQVDPDEFMPESVWLQLLVELDNTFEGIRYREYSIMEGINRIRNKLLSDN